MTKSFTIHDLPKEERPRERLVKFGEQALSAQELLQLILGRGIAGESVVVTAQKLLTQFGSLQKLSEAMRRERFLKSLFGYKERKRLLKEFFGKNQFQKASWESVKNTMLNDNDIVSTRYGDGDYGVLF